MMARNADLLREHRLRGLLRRAHGRVGGGLDDEHQAQRLRRGQLAGADAILERSPYFLHHQKVPGARDALSAAQRVR